MNIRRKRADVSSARHSGYSVYSPCVRLAVFALLLLIAGCAASPIIAESYADEDALQRFRGTKAISQLWRPDQPPPEKLADIGLSKDFKLCYLAIWQDGGSVGYLFRDKADRFFAYCRYYPRYFDGQDVVTVEEPVYFVGVLYPIEPGGRRIAHGSSSEAFLRSLIGGQPKAQPAVTVGAYRPDVASEPLSR